MKSLTNCKNPSSNPFQEACSGFPKAACDAKFFFLKPIIKCTLEKINQEEQTKPGTEIGFGFRNNS
jgi:hypothetical protein